MIVPLVIVSLTVPTGTQSDQFAVEVDADAAAHADDHRLAVQRLKPLLEVVHDILGDLLDPIFRADHRLQLRPLRLELLLTLHLFALGGFLEIGVDLRLFVLVQGQLRQAAFVVDGHRGPVLNGALDIVDADVIAEHGPGIGVLKFYRCPGESDEGGVGQCVSHMTSKPVDEVVLATVGFVGDHDDIAPVRQFRMGVALLFREEFLDGGKDHTPGVHRQLVPQIGPALRLRGRLAQQVLAPGERAVELVVQVVPVGEHHHGRIFHCRFADDGSGVEGHRQALPRPLGVPHDTDPPVAGLPAGFLSGLVPSAGVHGSVDFPVQFRCAQRFVNRVPHRVELVITRHLLFQRAAAVVIENDKVAYERKETVLFEHALQHHLELGQVLVGQRLPGNRAPWFEPLLPRRQRADSGFRPVRDHEHFIHGEQCGQFGLVRLKLVPGRPDCGVLVGRILQFDDAEGQTVEEQHDIRPAVVLVLRDGELIDRQPIVPVGPFEVDDANLVAAHVSAGIPIFDVDAVYEHPVKRAISGFQGGSFGAGQHAAGIVQGGQRKGGVQFSEDAAKPVLKGHLSVVIALCVRRLRRDIRSVQNLPSETGEPVKSRLLDVRFGEGGHSIPMPTSDVRPWVPRSGRQTPGPFPATIPRPD